MASPLMDMWVQACRGVFQVNPEHHSTLRGEHESFAHKVAGSTLPRKTSTRVLPLTVPQTTTGRRGEKPKALERTVVKELGKMTP